VVDRGLKKVCIKRPNSIEQNEIVAIRKKKEKKKKRKKRKRNPLKAVKIL